MLTHTHETLTAIANHAGGMLELIGVDDPDAPVGVILFETLDIVTKDRASYRVARIPAARVATPYSVAQAVAMFQTATGDAGALLVSTLHWSDDSTSTTRDLI